MSKLKIAIQKSGRLNKKSIEFLQECGIKFPNGDGKLVTQSSNFPLDILFLRDDDIPQYVEQGVADIGIIGENEVAEQKRKVKIVERLGFATCRLSLAVPKDAEYSGNQFLNGKKIATSYPHLLSDYLNQNKINATIEVISGSVEIAPSIGIADAICDLVSTGSTLISNGLKEVAKIFESQAVLVSHPDLNEEKQKVLDKILFRIQAVKKGRGSKYILLNAPNEKLEQIIQILPGLNSPTVLPLAKKGWSSLHSVISEERFWEVIDELKNTGAEGILVVPIEKMIM